MEVKEVQLRTVIKLDDMKLIEKVAVRRMVYSLRSQRFLRRPKAFRLDPSRERRG